MNSRVDLSYSARPAKNPDPPAQAGYRSILISRSGTPRFKDLDRYQIGDRIGDRYEVLAIDRGGMGVVYATLDHRTKLRRALRGCLKNCPLLSTELAWTQKSEADTKRIYLIWQGG